MRQLSLLQEELGDQSCQMKLQRDSSPGDMSQAFILLVMFTSRNSGTTKHGLGLLLEQIDAVTKVFRRIGVASQITQSAFDKADEWTVKIM